MPLRPVGRSCAGTQLAPMAGMDWRQLFARVALWCVGLGLAGVCGAGASPADPGPRLWEPPSEVVGLRDASAVAVDPASGRVAVGDRGGVRLFLPGAAAERVLRRGPVHDLAFGDAGVLFAATARGLFRITPRGESARVGLGPAGPESLLRLAVARPWVAAAGAGGLFVAADGRRFAQVAGGISTAGVAAVALARRPGASGPPEIAWIAQGALFRGRLEAGDPPQVIEVDRLGAPAGELARDAHDLVFSDEGLTMPSSRSGAWRSCAGVASSGSHPRGPPGLARCACCRRRTGSGSQPTAGWCSGKVGRGRGAVRRRLPATVRSRRCLRGRPESGWPEVAACSTVVPGANGPLPTERSSSIASSASPRSRKCTPPWSVTRTFRTGGCATSRAAPGGAAGCPRRRCRARTGTSSALRLDSDQVLSSGLQHELFDRQRDRGSDYEAGLALAWDFGDLAYHPESIDVSREAREVIELRDEVLDEVTQLYYERRRVLLALRQGSADDADLARLRLRADELAAGLDAWTGGWFSRHTAALAPASAAIDLSPRCPEESCHEPTAALLRPRGPAARCPPGARRPRAPVPLRGALRRHGRRRRGALRRALRSRGQLARGLVASRA